MNLTMVGLLLLFVVAGVCGAIGRSIGGGPRGGVVVSIAIGFVGALLGTFMAHALHLPELFTVAVDGHVFPVLWSVIGAASFVAAIHFINHVGRRRGAYA
jgi:uncharacterized membrane protein YeaQ/YmgE (transglycosylase-associated protein family)